MPMRFRHAPIALLLAAVCLAGCGSSSKSSSSNKPMSAAEYRSALEKIGKQESKAHAATNGISNVTSVAKLRQILSSFATAQNSVADAVAALRPPANARAANAELVTALRETTSSLGTLDTALAKDTTLKQALADIQLDKGAQKAGRDVDSALAKLVKLGYAKPS